MSLRSVCRALRHTRAGIVAVALLASPLVAGFVGGACAVYTERCQRAQVIA